VHQAQGTRIDPGWDPTYRFASASADEASAVHMHALSVCLTVQEYPTSYSARRELVGAYGPHLVDEWVERGLPLTELYHLVHRPGELGPSEAARVHRRDQADALAEEYGGVPVVIVLANVALAPQLVVSRVSFR
jgi:hypothetical protein